MDDEKTKKSKTKLKKPSPLGFLARGLKKGIKRVVTPVKKKIMKATAPKDAKKVGSAQKVTKEVFKLTEPKSRRTQAGIRDTKGRLSGVSKKQKKIASAIRVGVPLAVGASLLSRDKKSGPKTAGAGSGGKYKVKSGDSLSMIAKDKGTTLAALLEANGIELKDANKLKIGQPLTIPAKVKDRKSVFQGMKKSEMKKIQMPKKKKMGGGKVYKNMGGLVGGQTKLDMNKDGMITRQDFKMMPKKKKMGGGKVYRRGGGRALRGMGKAIYSNKMY